MSGAFGSVDSDVLVIGAGPAGLAVSACLMQRGIRPLVVEQAQQVGAAWHAHYRRLHLHTVKQLSALPGMPFPDSAPQYVPREGVIEYLEAYSEHFGIRPLLGVRATGIVPLGGGWRTSMSCGREIDSKAVVVSTGANRSPCMPRFSGQEDYRGRVLHSRDYVDAAPFAGQRVVVVGMGNTGAEIALDLAEQSVQVAISLRSPVNIVYRDALGRPTQKTSIALSHLPRRWGDAAASLLRDITVGDLRAWGIRTPGVSPLCQLREEGRTPVIDVGTLARIKSGDIEIRPGIEAFTRGGVRFIDGSRSAVDSVILATGYRADVQALFPQTQLPVDDRGLPLDEVGTGALAGIYFVGFDIRHPGGLLRTIGLQARAAAKAICAQSPALP